MFKSSTDFYDNFFRNIKQGFFVDFAIMLFYKNCGKQMGVYLLDAPSQSDYPWFSKCTLKLGLEKPILINSADISYLPSLHPLVYNAF